MTVRYKSATIDEFIEHHSHDVSRGGIFIKTPSPFPPGTLLKFEIRIQDEQSVLAGVGRVVWKREAPQAGDELPSGMGVKFIKIDDKSKGIIGKLVDAQDGKPSSFEAGLETPDAPAQPAAAKAESAPPKVESPSPRRGATMLGLGGIGGSSAPPPLEAKPVSPPMPAPAKAEEASFFPKTNPEEEMPPPEERTMMKQAAELLQQALAEAGGSLEELGAGLSVKAETKPAEKAAEPELEKKPVALDLPIAAESKAPEAETKHVALDIPVEAEKAADKAPEKQAEPERAAAGAALKAAPKAEPDKKPEPGKKPAAAAPVAAKAVPAATPTAPEEGSGSSKLLMGLLAAAVIGGGVLLLMTQKGADSGGIDTGPKPTAVTAKAPTTTTMPTTTAAPSAAPTAAVSASAATSARIIPCRFFRRPPSSWIATKPTGSTPPWSAASTLPSRSRHPISTASPSAAPVRS